MFFLLFIILAGDVRFELTLRARTLRDAKCRPGSTPGLISHNKRVGGTNRSSHTGAFLISRRQHPSCLKCTSAGFAFGRTGLHLLRPLPVANMGGGFYCFTAGSEALVNVCTDYHRTLPLRGDTTVIPKYLTSTLPDFNTAIDSWVRAQRICRLLPSAMGFTVFSLTIIMTILWSSRFGEFRVAAQFLLLAAKACRLYLSANILCEIYSLRG